MRQPLPDDYVKRRVRLRKPGVPFGVASNPGDYRVHWLRFLRNFPSASLIMVLVIWFFGWGTFNLQPIFFLCLLFTPTAVLVALGRVQNHFAFGNTVPGVVISHHPPLVAVKGDLSHHFGYYKVVKVVKQPLRTSGLGEVPLGTRVPMVALYCSGNDRGRWSDFKPVLLAAATKDDNVVQRAIESISEQEWLELENALATLPKAPSLGLHPFSWSPNFGPAA